MSNAFLSVIAGLGGMFGWGTSDFFANSSSEKIGHLKTFFWSQCVGLIFVLLLLLFFAFHIELSLLLIIFFAVGSVLYAGGYLLLYKGFEVGNVSVVSTVVNLWAVFTIILSYVFLHQRLSVLHSFAVFLIIIGVAFVSININDLKKRKIELLQGVKEGFFSALIFGFFWTLSDVLSKQVGWLEVTLFIKIGSALFLLAFSYFSKKTMSIKMVDNKTKLIVVLVGVLEGIGVLSVNFGLTIGEAILVTPISSALSVVTITLAVLFLHEKLTKIQFVGVLSVILGIILTSF